MNIHIKFVNRFSKEVKIPSNRGIKVAISEFDLVYKYIQQDYGDIECINEIRQHYIDAVHQKTSWGCNQLTKVLEDIIWEYR